MIEQGDSEPGRTGGLQFAAFASVGAGVIHALAAGIHSEHPSLARLFGLVAAAQIIAGLIALARGGRLVLAGLAAINLGSVAVWGVTRISGISWISGLETAEDPQFLDSVCAGLGAVAAVAAVAAIATMRTKPRRVGLGLPATAVGAVTVVAMLFGAGQVHEHDHVDEPAADGTIAADGHVHTGDEHADHTPAEDAAAATTGTIAADGHAHTDEAATDGHSHGDEVSADEVATDHSPTDDPSAWPRAWDPAQEIDFSGVEGVSPAQERRAERLVARTLEDLPQFADVTTIGGLGYRSIGDASTGHEHYVNIDYIGDDAFLDPTRPESLVYRVDGEHRTLVSVMFIANQTAIDDPQLVNYGGPLMQWHVHENLCWAVGDDGVPVVVGVTDADGNCAPGSVNAGGDNPMVHVWIAPHECGPFAALEGHGAGQTDPSAGTRTDQCVHEHGADAPAEVAVTPVPYDPTKPIDLSGVAGVTPEQQAYAENLVAVTLVDLPQWSDPAVAEAAGFHSIGDAATGHEHFIQWDWINDDVWLDPDHPESLVYEPQPDGSRQLVSAMYMLPDTMALEDVPDDGGALMQFHIHDDLCFTPDPVAPQVAGLTNVGGTCTAPLVALTHSPMIHVWLTPNECGPFAALEGVGAGQVQEGEEHLCDEAHGSH
ncbi:MAG: hypothetical protein H0U21_16770 [Acidimicrobiia bacterium]|nr:hypothetical protein [Acidimicrobiia bacterium]